MDRYFDNAFLNGRDDEDLHHFASRTNGVVLDNLVYRMTNDDLGDDEAQTLAASCYEAIAVMEAIIDTVPEDVARAAKAKVERERAKLDGKPTVKVGAVKVDTDSELAKALGDLFEAIVGGDDE